MENSRKHKAPIQTLQFTIIGISNAAVDIGSLNLLLLLYPTDHSGILTLFNTIAYCLAISNSYFWNSRITFRRSARGNRKQIFFFVLQGLFSLLINNGVFLAFNLLLQFIDMPSWIRLNFSKGLAMFASFVASFFMIKYFVFKDKQQRHKEP
ncbi:GtrA family protein [Planococcus donghaensis]|uniref:Polysaccharide synthesis protein GtrA n=1 Tax=Planococcus donghaensis TaxID=414778 RepID=A0A1C7EJD1_9BACL|nr:GtrA family protein [Planococcus donghaensis]ANU24084.1 polysaccharide synthesis protein GtrA [Planococcus donghaensis]